MNKHFRDNFFVRVWINSQLRSSEGIPDPLVRITVKLSFADRLRVLVGGRLDIGIEPVSNEVARAVMSVLNVQPEARDAARKGKG